MDQNANALSRRHATEVGAIVYKSVINQHTTVAYKDEIPWDGLV